jgi:acetylornithine deacetylase
MTDQVHIDALYEKAVSLLKGLIAIPSFSREEDKTADLIESFFQQEGIPAYRFLNNVWALNKYFDPAKPIILLNSHHDTVKPNPQYTKHPFQPIVEDGKLYGLGSNDAGGCLVSLIATFVHFYAQENLPFNLVLAATAEEEITGHYGIEALLLHQEFLQSVGQQSAPMQALAAIVGEPTQMELAIAEKGLLVLDCTVHGKAGHAAREEGENAIYKALHDIQWFQQYRFDKVSEWLGPVKMSVTVVNTENKAHNVVPAVCQFVVDIRINDFYTHEEVLSIIRQHLKAEVKPRSARLRSSRIALDHPLVQAGVALGRKPYGSPTCSDKALMPFPALKMGPGNSARSHTADEYIFLDEVKEGIALYIALLEKLL